MNLAGLFFSVSLRRVRARAGCERERERASACVGRERRVRAAPASFGVQRRGARCRVLVSLSWSRSNGPRKSGRCQRESAFSLLLLHVPAARVQSRAAPFSRSFQERRVLEYTSLQADRELGAACRKPTVSRKVAGRVLFFLLCAVDGRGRTESAQLCADSRAAIFHQNGPDRKKGKSKRGSSAAAGRPSQVELSPVSQLPCTASRCTCTSNSTSKSVRRDDDPERAGGRVLKARPRRSKVRAGRERCEPGNGVGARPCFR